MPDPATGTDGDDVVREAIEAMLLIGTWGLDESKQPDVWTLAMRAKRVLDGNPMTEAETAEFRAKTELWHRPASPKH